MSFLTDVRRSTTAAPKNPYDKSTIVSIYPKELVQRNPTTTPNIWKIPAGKPDAPSFTVIESAHWWKETHPEEPLLEIPNYSMQVADSIIKDYCNGLLACNMGKSMPGLFWIPGEHNKISALTYIDPKNPAVTYHSKLAEAKARQITYFKALVKMADIGWVRFNGNPLTISEDMRMAARELGELSKDWMESFQRTETNMERCPACGSFRDAKYPICVNCKTNVPEFIKSTVAALAEKEEKKK